MFGNRKRKSHSPKYSYQIFWGNICYSFGKMYSPRKFLKDHKFCGFEICSAKLECSDIVYIRAMNGRYTSSIKMKKNLFKLEEMCEKMQKSINCGKNLRKFQKLKLQKPISLNTSSLRDLNNPYLEDDLANLHL